MRARWQRWGGAVAAVLLLAAPALARDSLGVFEDWAVFRDPATPRCYAIAEPESAGLRGGYITIGYWPRARQRGQIFFRLPRAAGNGSATLTLDGQRFTLLQRGAGAWAQNQRMDAAILASIRSATAMTLAVREGRGASYSATWRLRGAATAIDAAALGCAGR